MQRSILIVILTSTLVVGGCAGAEPARSDIERPGAVMDGNEGAVFLLDRGASQGEVVVAAEPDAVWRALFEGYEALGIEIAHVESGQRVLGNRNFVVRRNIAGERASLFFDCGLLTSGAPAADVFRIRVDMLSRIAPADEGTRLTTTVAATGRDATGRSGSSVRCESTGRLEARLGRAVAAALAP